MSVNDPFIGMLFIGLVGVWERDGPRLAVEAGDELNMAEPRSMVKRRSLVPWEDFVVGIRLP